MQATMTAKCFGPGRFGGILVAAGLAAGILIGAAGQAVIDNPLTSERSGAAVTQPRAYADVGQGEGLVGAFAARSAALKGHAAPGMGEGLIDTSTAVAALQAQAALGQGEGIPGGIIGRDILTVPAKAHFSESMGEGRSVLGRSETTLKGYAADGQGEGRVDISMP